MKTILRIPAKMKLEINFLKNLCVAFLLFSGMAFGQIVNIPDVAFKAKLLSASPTVHVGSNVNPNSSSTPNVYTSIDSNNNGEIEVSEAQNIVFLNVNWFSGVKISSLQGIEAFINLKQLYCNSNNITTVDFSNQTNLTFVSLENNLLTSINITGCSNLNNLDLYKNQISTINLSGCPLIRSLNLGHNQFQTFNANDLQNLQILDVSYNSLNTISINSLNLLNDLNLGYNQLTNVELINLPQLYKINVQNNQLTALDLSTTAYEYYISGTLTYEISCNNNLNLTHINLKNGYTNDEIYLNSGNLNNQVQYICNDENDVFIDFFVNSNSLLSTYCSFTPGGNYNVINGQVKFDSNNNGCDASDLPQSNIRINIIDGTNTGATFTNNLGTYNFYTQTGSFILTPAIENSTWFTFSPATATIPFANNNNNTTTQDFCIAANGVHNDIEVVVSTITPARPGFDTTYKIVYKNKGNQTLSGNVNFTYNDSVLDFVSATVAPNSQNTGVLNWSYANLLPFENRSFYLTLHVNAPTATPPVNIADVLSFNASITPMITDENPLDNSFTYNQTVVGSFDPNNITCLEGDIVPPSTIGSYLHYGVNFENTGTYPAENIVVKVVIDTVKYDVNSLQMLNTSNPAYTKITGNVVEFIFQNIMLDTGGHGNVLFKIKTNNNLVNGDIVSKRADIFFDYNAPINTGMANTTFQLLNNGQFVIDNSIEVSPNPTSSIITINGNNNIKSVQVYDVQGRLLETKLIDDAKATINISDKTNGIYFLKITSENGSKVEKIVKE